MIIAFDVDGTLVTYCDKPRREIIQLLITLHDLGNRIIVWSGGGKEYADVWVRRLFITDYVDEIRAKPLRSEEIIPDDVIDISFDDELVDIADKNIKV